MIVFRHIKPFSLVDTYQLFGRPNCLNFLDANMSYQLQMFSMHVEPQCLSEFVWKLTTKYNALETMSQMEASVTR
jgi:hypothetical protein